MKRREFFKWLGTASAAGLSACKVKDADKKLLPYLVPLEEGLLPGIPRYVRTTCMECPALCGLNVKIRDDIPIKLEGNPEHPINQGALCMRGQASLGRLYHPQRIKQPLLKDTSGKFKGISWAEAINRLLAAFRDADARGMRKVYLSSRTTGTLGSLIDEFCQEKQVERCKEVEIYHHGALKAANQTLFGLYLVPYFHIQEADVLVTFGADLLETFISPVAWARQYRIAKEKNQIKWCHIEPYLSLTGAAADTRITCNPGSESYLLAYLLGHTTQRRPVPAELMVQIPAYSLDEVAEITGIEQEVIQSLAQTLQKAKQPLVIGAGPAVTGYNGPVAARYTALLQWALGMVGNTMDFDRALNHERPGTSNDLFALGAAGKNNQVGAAVFSRLQLFNTMPEYLELIRNYRFKTALSQMPTPLTEICDLVLPLSDPLESWGDVEPWQGLKSPVQPVIKPLHDTKSEGDILLNLLGREQTYQDYLADHWPGMDENWIEQGYKISAIKPRPVQLQEGIKIGKPGPLYQKDCLFILPSLRTFDGRSSDIALLAEIPDPLTAVSYDKWISLSRQAAVEKNLATGDLVEIQHGDMKTRLPAVIKPGLPAGVLTLAIDALSGLSLPLDPGSGEFMFCLESVKVDKTGESMRLPRLAGAYTTGKRGIMPVLEHNGHDYNHHPAKQRTLYRAHEHKNYRWAMAIDLDACTGCSACVAACYIENNVPLVGRQEHLRGREMSWLRIEPYYNDPQQPEFIPMMCQQCDNAPCETVCPVFATYHNPEGLNAQVYNRCVGTRYCANNCPYKVRRFNWFDHAHDLPLYQVSNPDLSVRPRGVMEKCTFCSQRIRFIKDRAKNEARPVKDGEIVPACAQTCPSGAITFGSLLDPDAKVSQLVKSDGAYRILAQLGTEPAVYYIKRKKKKMG